jgi:hypothetical protein
MVLALMVVAVLAVCYRLWKEYEPGVPTKLSKVLKPGQEFEILEIVDNTLLMAGDLVVMIRMPGTHVGCRAVTLKDICFNEILTQQGTLASIVKLGKYRYTVVMDLATKQKTQSILRIHERMVTTTSVEAIQLPRQHDSGLMDLTREGDDTSLGAVLDQIDRNQTTAPNPAQASA